MNVLPQVFASDKNLDFNLITEQGYIKGFEGDIISPMKTYTGPSGGVVDVFDVKTGEFIGFVNGGGQYRSFSSSEVAGDPDN